MEDSLNLKNQNLEF